MRLASSLLVLTACWSSSTSSPPPQPDPLQNTVPRGPAELEPLPVATGASRQRMRGRITNPACGAIDVQRLP